MARQNDTDALEIRGEDGITSGEVVWPDRLARLHPIRDLLLDRLINGHHASDLSAEFGHSHCGGIDSRMRVSATECEQSQQAIEVTHSTLPLDTVEL